MTRKYKFFDIIIVRHVRRKVIVVHSAISGLNTGSENVPCILSNGNPMQKSQYRASSGPVSS